uniref:Uncharacterized protein n=1 Tax=Romanomermis culicivorax TaxID=13658 RepID=A0A915KDF7_ROMCU
MNLPEKERKIINCDNAASAKQIGDQIEWNSPTTLWTVLASRTLYDSYWYKSKPMHQALFNMHVELQSHGNKSLRQLLEDQNEVGKGSRQKK